MPGLDDWLNSPLTIIKNLYDGDNKTHTAKVKEYFETRIADKNALNWIPSLNDTALHDLKTNSLVRMRCMIQDMYDPEYYLGWYEVRDKNSGASRMVCGKYKDVAECKPGEEILVESNKNITLDRQTLYCVPIPGENEWVKEVYSTRCKSQQMPSTSSGGQNRSKRPLDTDEDADMDTDAAAGGDATTSDAVSEQSMDQAAESDNKKTKTEGAEGSLKSSGPDLNFPLPGEKGPACIAKVYDDLGFKVNEVVEFIGVLSNDPFMVSFPDDNSKSSLEDNLMEEASEEDDARSPPPSLVPRLHVILAEKLSHENPLLHSQVMQQQSEVDSMISEARQIRNQLLDIFTHALLGDSLSAEFLLCHLISTVYARQDVVALGKYSINLSGCPNHKYTQYLYDVLKQLVTKSHFFPLTIQNLNKGVFTPAKDYKENRLKSGMLQLSDSTHLVLDETAMEAGQLDATGVKNLTALGNIIKWQKVEYDFNFHRQDFAVNLPVLMLSEGKCIIQCDSQVRLQPKQMPDDMGRHFEGLAAKITPLMLEKMRCYLSVMRLLSYDLPENVRQAVQEDFVEMRREDPKNMTAEDFHSLLILSRLLCLSYGKSTLSLDLWQRAKTMEKERKRRLDPPMATAPSS